MNLQIPRRTASIVIIGIALAVPASGQTSSADRHLRGVPATQVSATPLPLSLADAIKRGLENNLDALIETQRVRSVEGGRLQALGDLLPHVSAALRQSNQLVNIAAYGFTGFAGIPALIGPYGVFDARIAVSAPIFDSNATNHLREENATLKAEQFTERNTRQSVILVVANLYLLAIADDSRAQTAQSQVATAEALVRLAEDQKASGLVAGIEVLRQQVQVAAARQRLIAAVNAFDKDKLSLARAIGLPAAQSFELVDKIAYSPAPAMTLEQATEEAHATRDDLRSAEARADAAQAARQAAAGNALPTFRLDADYGALGSSASTTKRTYAAAAMIHFPLYEGGATRGKIQQADAEVRLREAELADLKAGVDFDIRAAFLDLQAADAGVDVAKTGEALARQQLDQAQDRFRAGVASSIELVQAQEALTVASDQYIASVYGHNIAKASLARTLGVAEARFAEFVKGQE
jgi:outer membrane protein TolC